MRVVVVGMGKSGTTAMIYAIKSAMPADTQLIFEPAAFVRVEAANVAAKFLLNPLRTIEDEFFLQFSRKVLLVRDPRDVLISRALYRVRANEVMIGDRAKFDAYFRLLQMKEQSPASVSLTRINALFHELTGAPLHCDKGLTWGLDYAVAWHERFTSCMIYHYEQLIEGSFAVLGDYLSLDPKAMKPEVPSDLQRVVRSRRAGNWRDWFCPEDVEHYRPMLLPYMQRYGYADEWSLNPHPMIRQDECTGYIRRLIRDRNSAAGIPVP